MALWGGMSARFVLTGLPHLPYHLAMMIVGFNTDVRYRGETFHVQTEEKGANNPTIETLVYNNGEILLSRRISYAQFLQKPDMRARVKEMMKNQHEQIIGELKGGHFLHLLSLDTQIIEDQSLDDMVLQYLGEHCPDQAG